MTPHEMHNRLAEEFVLKVAGATKSEAEMMVVLETTIVAAMMILRRGYGHPPQRSTILIEAAVQRAIERFAGAELRRG